METKEEPEIYVDETLNASPHLDIEETRFLLFGRSVTQVKAIMKEIEDLEVFDGEVFVSSYPKSGTTWVQEIVWQIMRDPEDEGSKLKIDKKFPYLEYPYPGLDKIKTRTPPRLIKTHFCYRHLPLNLRQGRGKDVHGVIRQIAGFLGRELSDLQVTKTAQSTTFESMKSNPLLDYSWFNGEEAKKNDLHFLRKGTVGDWKNYFTPEMENEFETKLLAPLKSIGLNFKES